MLRYVMLRDSESVILSEPVSLMKMPEGSESVTLWLSYDPEQLGGLLSHTMIMRFDPDDGSGEQFYPVENTVTDEQQHRLSAEITEPGIYFAYDYDAWARLWGIQTDSALCYRNPDIGFSVEARRLPWCRRPRRRRKPRFSAPRRRASRSSS